MTTKEKSPLPLTVEDQRKSNLLKVLERYARPALLAGLADVILIVALFHISGVGRG